MTDLSDKPKGDAQSDNKVNEVVVGLGDDLGDDDVIVLKSKETKEFPIDRKSAMMSNLIKTTLEGDKDAKEVSLFHIEGPIVQKVCDYMKYHKTVPPRAIEKPLQSTNLRELVDKWDADFVDVDQETMFKLLLAANYMDIKPLLYLVCAKVASLMKGKTPDQIRKTFNIRSDYTPAEEEEVRREHKDLIG